MPILHLVVLAVVQGITEFLPISSSGHLVLVPIFAGWPDQGILMDIAVHVGTLGAVLVYLSRDIWGIVGGVFNVMRGRSDDKAILAVYIVVATLPLIAAGYFLNKYYPEGFRSIEIIGWTTLGFGLFLALTDWMGMTLRRLEHIRFLDAVIIGLFQILALIPGTSRSGITISAARLLGIERFDAARFSMLLSIPAILGAGTLKGLELYESGNAEVTTQAIMAAGMAFIAALIAIAIMMSWLRRSTYAPFVLYRIALGVVILAVAYGFID